MALRRGRPQSKQKITFALSYGFAAAASILDVYPCASQPLHRSMVSSSPAHPSPLGFIIEPSANSTHPMAPPGCPPRNGQYMNVSTSPGSKVLPFTPRPNRPTGLGASKLHRVVAPSSS